MGDPGQHFSGRRLLIVEDEWLLALELQRIIEHLGATVVGPVGTVEAALQLLSDTLPDAALLDVNLREHRATLVAEACRDRGVPFVLVTGYGRLQLEEPVLQSALRVQKPFDERAIHDAIATLLDKGLES